MTARTGGRLVVETLEALGITQVFGIPGQHALGLFEALNDSSLNYVSARVENNAAFAADGYARATRRPATLFLSTGPGALTSLAGLQEAYATSVPMIVVSSQVPEHGVGGRRNGLLHQLDDQKTAAANVTKVQFTVLRSSSIPSMLQQAYEAAMAAPRGPVWVEIPEDILLAETNVPPVEELTPTVSVLPGVRSSLEAAARTLSNARSKVIISGGGVAQSGASAEVVALAERTGAIMVTPPGGVSTVPAEHPLALANWIEDYNVTEVLNSADVVLAVGTAVGEVTSNYFTLRPSGQFIQIDADQRVLESNYQGLGICADARLALSALLELVPEADSSAAESLVRDVRSAIDAGLSHQDLKHEREFMAALRRSIPTNTPTYWDMTIAAYWAWNVWTAEPDTFFTAQGAGGLGYGFPAAIGGAVGAGRRTLAVAGDGSSMYSIGELATAKQHNVPVTWLIVDDGGYGILREYMNDTFGRATATELARPDFVALAEAFEVPARRVAASEVGPAVAKSLAKKVDAGPEVIVVETLLKMWEPTHLPHV
ncbi:acetolactate synthase [Corynebacterium sp. HMSC05H05]|uniref:thiamine pyrophosphate-binding protein n=1 Tax=Corynebacterium sp. HMSC05H05 TaxID=1581119 RepID=UPI0008A28C3E|nr:thiamine pyrophosphate-binding protein [Corynebacterium sp. HMSC05H05]OFT59532.1 acetolactate synthase [Corynebacterium sp. HMSC05H05]